MDERDLYAVLGVARDADVDEIKSAWRDLARALHPDRAPGDADAEARFQEAAEAWSVLSDPNKRMVYDAFGLGALRQGWTEELADALRAQQQGAAPRPAAPPPPPPKPRPKPSTRLHTEAKVEARAGERGPRPGSKVRGHDARAQVVLDLAEAAAGGTRDVTLEEAGPCSGCDGTGKRASGRYCSRCQGKGVGVFTRTVTILLPISPESGATVRYPGLAATGPHGHRGDLHVTFTIRPDPRFRREGLNLEVVVPISAALATRGGRIEVPTLAGSTAIDVQAGVTPGQRIRLPGLGLPGPDNRPPGDLYAVITIP